MTIVVALSLLALLTVAAVGMSRNSLREVMLTGTTRQGAMARNCADSGLHWSIRWLEPSSAPDAQGTALSFHRLRDALLQQDTRCGVAYSVQQGASALIPYRSDDEGPETDQELPAPEGYVQGFTLGLTRMGKLAAEIGQGTAQGAYRPAVERMPRQAPDLWSVRSDGSVSLPGPGGMTFRHAKESWIATPVQ